MNMPTWRRKYYNLFSKYYDRFVALHSSDAGGSLREIARILNPGRPFLMMEHEVPSRRLIRYLFYIRMYSMGTGRALQILKYEKKLLLTCFRSALKIRTPTGNSKIWIRKNRSS